MIIKTRCCCGSKRFKVIELEIGYNDLKIRSRCRKCGSIYYFNLVLKSKLKFFIAKLEINLIAKRDGY